MQSQKYRFAAATAAVLSSLLPVLPAAAEPLPAIKAGSTNAVPACSTPGRLQAYLEARNQALDARFQTIAIDYMREGEALGLRWDYAFFQMIMETGQLSFKNGNRAGDVKPAQNNFAGLGATGGVPGESFSDVATGVRAHLQHVLLYAGEKLDNPVAERTRKVQEWGVLTDWHKSIKHAVTYADLATKWAPKSKSYVDSLVQIAEKFASEHCKKPDPHPEYAFLARGQTVPQVAAAVPIAAEKSATVSATVSGADLARNAVANGDGMKSALGATSGVKILNPPMSSPMSSAASSGASSVAASVPSAQLAETAPVALGASPKADGPAARTAPTKTAAVGAAPKSLPPQPETALVPPQAALSAAQVAPVAPAPVAASKCRVWTASYGGQRAVIVKSTIDSVANFTVLDVNEGQEAREAEAFIAAYAKGGTLAGEFATQNKALEKAFELCPEG